TLSSRNTVVGSTSVFIRVAPAKMRTGPNSPSDRAHARVKAVTTPGQAVGRATRQNARAGVQPRVRATCSARGSVRSNVTRMVRAANAAATANWARITAGTWYVTGMTLGTA